MIPLNSNILQILHPRGSLFFVNITSAFYPLTPTINFTLPHSAAPHTHTTIILFGPLTPASSPSSLPAAGGSSSAPVSAPRRVRFGGPAAQSTHQRPARAAHRPLVEPRCQRRMLVQRAAVEGNDTVKLNTYTVAHGVGILIRWNTVSFW